MVSPKLLWVIASRVEALQSDQRRRFETQGPPPWFFLFNHHPTVASVDGRPISGVTIGVVTIGVLLGRDRQIPQSTS